MSQETTKTIQENSNSLAELNKLKAELEEAKLKEQLYNLRQKELEREKELYRGKEKSPYSVEQDLKAYQNISSITVEKPTEPSKTIGDLKRDAMSAMVRERQDFIEETMYGNQQENRPYKDNARHFHETAFINIYENSSEGFKKIVGDRMELLKKCDYWGLLELDMLDNVTQKQFLKEVDKKSKFERYTTEIELTSLGRAIMMNNRRIV